MMGQEAPVRETAPLEHGVWAVVATPFAGPRRAVDVESLTSLVRFYEECGTTGLTVLGVFGEAASLSGAERDLVLRTVVQSSSSPLVVGVTSLATAPAIGEVEAMLSVAGDRLRSVMVQVNSPMPEVVIEHLGAIHEATGVPIVLQDYPGASHVTVSTDALIAIVRSCPFVSAIKEEAPPTALAVSRLTSAVGCSVFGGLGGVGLLDELAAGSSGAMTGFSFTEALVACVDAWRNGDHDGARALFIPFLPLVNYEQQQRIALALRKDLLARRGLIAEPTVRPPAAEFPEELSALAAAHLDRVPVLGGEG